MASIYMPRAVPTPILWMRALITITTAISAMARPQNSRELRSSRMPMPLVYPASAARKVTVRPANIQPKVLAVYSASVS